MKSVKKSTKFLLSSIIQDTRSTTGSNLRNILLRTSKSTVFELLPEDALSVEYHPITIDNEWKVDFISEIIQAKHKQLNILNLSEDDLEDMLTVLCVS